MIVKEYFKNVYEGRRVLVTGHTGFKGSWLCMVLRKLGADVSGIALAPQSKDDHFLTGGCEADLVKSVIGDITTPELVESEINEFRPEFVFHLAAQPLVRRSYADPYETYNTNIMGSLHVLEAVRKAPNVRALVYVTSDKCYKNKEWYWGYRETDELGGHDPYSASKAMAELLFASHWNSFFVMRENFGAATVRAGNVIGGGDFSVDRIVPDCVRAAAARQKLTLRNPLATRPWQHVLDPIFGYLLVGAKLFENDKNFSGAWNFGPDSKSIRTVQELTDKFVSHWPGVKVEHDGGRVHPHEAGLLHLNCDKANHLLGWNPVWGFGQTVQYTAEWYQAWFSGSDMRKLSMSQIELFMEQMR